MTTNEHPILVGFPGVTASIRVGTDGLVYLHIVQEVDVQGNTILCYLGLSPDDAEQLASELRDASREAHLVVRSVAIQAGEM